MNRYTRERIANFVRILRNEKEISISDADKLFNALNSEIEWMTEKEVAQMLHISVRTLKRYVKKGLIPRHRVGNSFRYNKSEILTLMGVNHI